MGSMNRDIQGRRTRAAAAGALRSAVVAALICVLSPPAAACPACYGGATGPVIDGMNAAVLVMIGITGGVFSWIVALGVRIARRERAGIEAAATATTDEAGSDRP
jgi:hypothetical protein